MNEDTGEQPLSRHDALEKKKVRAEHLAPWQYKKGQSGNPSGRPKGISLKEYAKNKLASMSDEEREEFLNGINKNTIWEMSEGKAPQQTTMDVKGELIVKKVTFDEYNNDSISTETQ